MAPFTMGELNQYAVSVRSIINVGEQVHRFGYSFHFSNRFSQREALIRQSEEFGIADRCHFTGYVSPDGDLPAKHRLDDVFVTTSVIETFGIVIFEAMAAAYPVVAIKSTSILELVDDKRSGLLLHPQNVDGLAEKMIWLLQNPEEARKMGQVGQKTSQQYNHETILSKHLQLYQSKQQSN